VVLGDQERCRGWRACVAACPYKKVFYNWASGKSEKCILCFPRVETGQAPACFHSCVGRIRFFGVLLYDASRLAEVFTAADASLLERYRSVILDPSDPAVAAAAARCGVPEATIEAARRSPVFEFVSRWKLALPLHPEFRTLPNVFYVPPLSPAMAVSNPGEDHKAGEGPFDPLERARIPLRFLATLFAAGDEGPVRYALRKEIAVRWHRRAATVGDVDAAALARALEAADCTPSEAEAIYRMTALSTFQERIVVPPAARERAIEATEDALQRKESAGFGFLERPGDV
jgi:nitrate reductase / nitrite oxidoreductase, beta subunit